MRRTLLQAKLHRARVTSAYLHYEGSCGIDEALLEISGIREFEWVEIYNINNGERFSTYVIKEQRNSREISLNGAAARLAMLGDPVIICAYSSFEEEEAAKHVPVIVLLDENNKPQLRSSVHV